MELDFMSQNADNHPNSGSTQVATPQKPISPHTSLFEHHGEHKSSKMLHDLDFVCAAAVPVNSNTTVKPKMTPKKLYSKKNKQTAKAKVFEHGDLRRVIQQTGNPDVVAILESKIDVQKLLSLPGFQDWCRDQRYNHVFISWSSNESRGGKGYAGIVVLSRISPVKVAFGMPALVNGEARSITLEFETFNFMAVYSPCTGYNIQKIKERAHFDDILRSYTARLYRSSKKPIIIAGDLNVNPRAQDFHKNAFTHMAKLKKQSGLKDDPGCSPQEIDAYYNIIAQFAGVNVWEKLRQYDPHGMTWHPKFNSGAIDHFLVGQRLDHFIASEEMLNGICKLQIQGIKTYQGVGSSDHCPLVITLTKQINKHDPNEVDPILRSLVSNPDGPTIVDVSTGRQKTFDIYESPVIFIKIADKEEPTFIDSGAPFSIFNPPLNNAAEDRIYDHAQILETSINCRFGGVGGGRIIAQGNYLLDVTVGQQTRSCRFVFLKTHEPSLPRFLLGMDVITGALEGVRIRRHSVQFEIAPEVVFPARINPASKLYKTLDAQTISCLDSNCEGVNMANYFKLIAAAQYEQQQGVTLNEHAAQSGELDDERDFETQQALLIERFHDAPMPMIELQTETSASKLAMLVDSGSTYSLISSAVAKILLATKDAKEVDTCFEMPAIRVANGTLMTATKMISLRLSLAKDTTASVHFFVFDGLPLDAIIGNDVCEKWNATLSWGSHMWTIQVKVAHKLSVQISIPWMPVYGKYWRGPENLLAKDDFIIPPQCHSKVNLQETVMLKNYCVKDNFAFITGVLHQQHNSFKTAYGTSSLSPNWIQLANPTDNPIFIKKGEIVGLLHPREEHHVDEAADLNVTAADIHKEKEVCKTAIAKQKTMEEHQGAFLHESFVALLSPSNMNTELKLEENFTPLWCTCCDKKVCAPRNDSAINAWNTKLHSLAKLGVDIKETEKQTTQCELEKLVDFCLKQDKVINSHGKLDPERVILHDTALSIDLTEAPNFKATPRKTTPQARDDIDQMVQEKLQQGIIEKSSAPWSSNCVIIRKDGKTRIAVDYRKLNQITIKDSYLLPKISEIFEALHGTTWFTSVDCTQAYHQLPMKTEQDKDLTTFVTPGGGLYRYKFMPFGLANAGACWSRFIDDAMVGLRWQVAMVYADDILIYSKGTTVEGHIDHLEQVFDRLQKYGITVKGAKVRLGLKELPYLGQIISTKGCRPDPAKTKAISEIPFPENIGQLRRLVGMFAHYKKFIPNYSAIAAPLYAMTKKNNQIKRNSNNKVVLTPEQTTSFETLKRCLVQAPIMLQFPKWGCPYEVHCDASEIGMAAILLQVIDGKEAVLQYASQSFTPTETRYSSYEKECLALVWSVETFVHHLKIGQFKIKSDCKSLAWLDTKEHSSRIADWVGWLNQFDYKIEYRPGKLSQNVDGMTRQPREGDKPTSFGVLQDKALKVDSTTHFKLVAVLTRHGAKNKYFETEEEKFPSPALDLLDEKQGDEREIVKSTEPSIDKHAKPDEDKTSFFNCRLDKEGWDRKDWVEEQAADKNLAQFFNQTKEDTSKDFIIKDGLLLQIPRRFTVQKEGYNEKIVVPESLKAFVIGCHHNLPLHGHQGRKRTAHMISARYYWRGMSKDIRKWIQACSGCSKRKMPRPTHAGFTEIAQSIKPWQTVGIDIVGDLPVTKQGNKWILTMVDHFSRWPIGVAIPNRESATIARAVFDNLITMHGSPEKIISDQGKEFISKGMQELCKRWGIRKITTGGYNPTGNAACERFHKYLNASITILRSKDKPTDWDTYLQAVLFSYRVSVNDATGYSPYYLVNGRLPTVPLDLAFPLRHEEYKSMDDYVEKMTTRLNSAFELAVKQQYAAAVTNERRAPARTIPNFKSGDFLYVWARSSIEQFTQHEDGKKIALPKKWVNPWVGPFQMIRWQGNRYCVLNYRNKEKVFSVDRLSKHQNWDEVRPDTYKWELQEQKTEREQKHLLEGSQIPDADEIADDVWLKQDPQIGDVVVFDVIPSKDNPLQFGLGLIKEISIGKKGKIHFQWMGNYNMRDDKPFLPCWEDAKGKIYYKKTPEHKSHEALTGQDTRTKITIENAIMIADKDCVLNSLTQKIHASVHIRIKDYLRIEQAKEEARLLIESKD